MTNVLAKLTKLAIFCYHRVYLVLYTGCSEQQLPSVEWLCNKESLVVAQSL